MHLLERDSQFQQLEARLRDAQAGSGKVVLLSGEAGVGKSSLVEAFVALHGKVARALWGTCDALSTPRALGPVHEIAAQLPATTDDTRQDDASRDRLFKRLIDELASADRTSIVVLEDLHWADEATLDFVRFLARRIQRTRCLLIATFRDDELPAAHPVRAAIGELSGNHVVRVRLLPLSLAACGELAKGSGRDPALIYAITGGNPFFLREVLASAADEVPESVRDAIIARLKHCSPGARQVLELVSISPGKMESWLLAAVLGAVQAAVDESIDRGLLHMNGSALVFRHELARLAVNSTLPRARAQAWHGRVLSALTERGADVAQLVHHAEQANDAEAVLRYAPVAGKEAAHLGAHREAAAHFAAAQRHCGSLPRAEQAQLFELHAQECTLTNQRDQAMAAATRALVLSRELGDAEAQARALRIISRQHWQSGNKAQADQSVAEAIAVLEGLPPCRALAMAYSARSQLAMLCGRRTEALEFGERALALARRFEDRATESHALNNIGATLFATNPGQGFQSLERSLAIALEHHLHEPAGRAYANLLTWSVLRHDFRGAEHFLRDGMAYCEEHDVQSSLAYIRTYASRFELERGNWDEAAHIANRLLQGAGLSAVQRIHTEITLALVRARRGDPGVDELLDPALELALSTGEPQRIGRALGARAECAWYRGDLDRVSREATMGLAHAREHVDPWLTGELLFWQSRAQPVTSIPDGIAPPYRLMLAGDFRAAANEWQQLGMPYERALALAEGSEESLREALPLLETLRATPLAAVVRRRLREMGARDIPRGPHAATRRNPAGLTGREMEVLALLVHGRTNTQLARKLHVSPKTVDHHVAAILGKLSVRSRTAAVARAFALGIARAEKPQV